MYRFYHNLALDFVPFQPDDEFRMLELGCGTGTFINMVLEKFPNAHCVAYDYSDEMLSYADKKLKKYSERIVLEQRDLNLGLADIGPFQVIVSFSTLHHLHDANKRRLLHQVW